MAALQNVDGISFTVEVLAVKNGRKLGRIRPDEDGYYSMPLAVLGTVTDNRTYYEVEDFVSHLTSPNSLFVKCLIDGKLHGEYGHPPIMTLPEEMRLPRLMTVKEPNISHHIKKVWTGEKLETGGRIIYGLIKPTGPYGESLKESLDDPCLNTSFSLRSIAQSREENGITRRRIKYLVTFDYVCAGGYSEASKRYSPSVESLNINIPLTSKNLIKSTCALEHLSNTELNEIFGAKVVTIGANTTTYIDKQAVLQDNTGRLRSVFTSLLVDQNR